MASSTDVIESLGIQITSNASGATKSLNTLNKGLERLIGNLTSVQSKSAGTVIGNVGTQAQNTATATTNATKSFNTFNNSTKSAKFNVKSLASAFGHLYANFFLVIRAVKQLGKAVESSMDYIETYNYFNVTMEKIGKEWGKDYEQWEYDNAKTYAESFQDRIEELNEKMTGYTLGKEGEATYTGAKNLGLDVETMMNYQASIGAVTNSLGLMGETSVNVQKAMSMLSADLSSFKNIDLSSVMTNLQSGLIGQSRALYKFGLDITAATMQTYAYKLGLSKAVSEMSQAEKMQLRVLMILNQSKVAWGDQANTLNSVANQYRILKQQFSNLTRTIGNLFLPVVEKVLPVVNGLVIAMNELLQAFGISLWGDSWLNNLTSGTSAGYSDDTFDDINEDIENTDENLDKANESAKKLKNNLIGIDKLNIISPQEDTTSNTDSTSTGSTIDLSNQIANAVADYESVWEKAFENSENLAQKYANRIVNAFKTGDWKSVGEYFSHKIGKALADIKWEDVYKKASGFGTNFAEYLNGLIKPNTFNLVGSTIAKALNTAIYKSLAFATTFDWKNLGLAIAEGINGFFENYDFKQLANTIDAWVQGLFKMFVTAIKNIKWGKIFEGVLDFASELDISTVGILLLYSALKKLFNLLRSFTKTNSKLTKLSTNFATIAKSIPGVVSAWAEFKLISNGVEELTKGTDNLASSILKITGGLTVGAVGLTYALGGIGTLTSVFLALGTAVYANVKAINELRDAHAIETFVDTNGAKIETLQSNFENLTGEITSDADTINDKLGQIGEYDANIEETVDSIYDISNALKAGMITAEDAATQINSSMDELISSLRSKSEMTTAMILGLLYENEEQLAEQGINVTELVDKVVDETGTTADKLEELQTKLNNLEPRTTEWYNVFAEIKTITGELTNTKDAITDFNEEIKTINFSKFVNNTNLNTAAIAEKLQDFATMYENAATTINDAYDSYIEEIESNPDYSEALKENLISTANEMRKSDLNEIEQGLQKNLFIPLQNTIGQSLIKSIDTSITSSFSQTSHLQNWGETIYTPMLSVIESVFGDLGLDLEILEDGFIDELIDGLYVDDKGNVISGLRSDWQTVITNAMSNIDTSEAKKNLKGTLKDIFDLDGQPLMSFELDMNTTDLDKSISKALSQEGKYSSILEIGQIKVGSYATGGFPEDGFFFANHSELVGKFSNGKTAVANNAQITAGIEEASYRGFLRALAQSNGNGGEQTIIVQSILDGKQIAESTNRINARSGRRSLGYNAGY